MPLFNKKIIAKNLNVAEIPAAHLTILQNWQQRILSHDLEKQTEVALQGVFMQNVLVEILGYQAFGESDSYTVAKEYPIASGAVDLALGQFFNDKQGDSVHAVFELKGAKTKNLDAIMSNRFKTPVEQAWEYAVNAKGCEWVLVSNYVEIRLYAFGFTKKNYEVFELAKLTDPTEYARFMLCLQADNLLNGATKQLLQDSEQESRDITEKFYNDYKNLRENIITRLIADNPEIAPLDLIAPAQKLLDRVLFIAFCEDCGLLPKNSIKQAYEFVCVYDPHPIYRNFKGLFKAVDRGSLLLNVNAYNGGLFAYDKFFDKLNIADELCKGFLELASYDFSSEISVTVLGHIFEQSIADLEDISAQLKEGKPLQNSAQATSVSGKRKQQGVVYTPDHITAFIVEHTVENYLQQRFAACLAQFQIEKDGVAQWKRGAKTELNFWKAWLMELKSIKIVDPACGSGAFLVAAFDFLHQEYEKVNEKIAEISQSHSVFDLNKEILQNNLLGVDINSESIEITQLSLWLKTAEKKKKLVSIGDYFKQGNSLGFDEPVNLPGFKNLEGFCWKNAFPDIMESGGFDIVIGNPPYVRQELLSNFKPYLQQHYAVYHSVADLYAYFFELGLKLLKPNGMLGFISSSTFFKTDSGEPLRKFLQENATLKKVVDFGDIQVFEGVTTYPAILIFQNTKPEADSEIQFLALKDKLPEKLSDFFIEHHQIMQHSQLRSENWHLNLAELAQLRDKLTAGYPTLKEAYGSPLYGIKTGLNEAFVIDKATKEKLITQNHNFTQVLKPFLEGKDLKKWHSQSRDLWLIFMPKGWTQEKMGELLGEKESWEWLQNHYSAIAKYLEPFEKAAQKRGDKGDFWWELRACTYYEEFEKIKIQYGHFSAKPLFHLNSKSHYSNDKSYIIASADLFLLGLLNSSLFWYLIKGICPFVRGGYYELRAQYIETLPIPPATDEQKMYIAELASQCQNLAEQRYGLERNTQISITQLKIKKLTRKLQSWWELEFNDFLDELAKQKIEIPLKKQAEWYGFLSEAILEHQDFDLQIAILEMQLNNAVYALFNLTAEEIKLIEM
jgi:hypothetical protein